MNYSRLLQVQREFFLTQQTKTVEYRKEKLLKLKTIIQQNEKLLYEAIYKDFGKSETETYLTEIAFVYNEIDYFLKNLHRLSRPEKVSTNLPNLPGKSRIIYEPLGCILIIGAWNYPYQLTLSPLVAAMASGNCCIVKPSEIPQHTMLALEKIINENFADRYVHVIRGGVEETTELLKLRFDKIFFTGSTRVGKIVYEAAARNLVPVTLELGGKSPVFVTQYADIDVAARRIVWGKFLNAGQTCIAPDYIYVHESIRSRLLEKLKLYIEKFCYTAGSSHYVRIINAKNFKRLTRLLQPEKIYYGGTVAAEKNYIAPTLIYPAEWSDPVMQEEIFGPLLPVLTYTDLYETFDEILEREKPLSAYIFTGNKSEKELFRNTLSFGGGCINDVLMHISNGNLPFGGVGFSGTGNYHGKFGFECFSHPKAVLERATWGEPMLKYPPYTENKFRWLKKLL